MSVGRLYRNLSSSDLPWNWLLSLLSIFLVSEDSEEKDGDEEEDESLRCLGFFLWDSCLFGEGEDFSIDEDKEVLLRLLFQCLFLYEFFCFLCLIVFLPLFRFPETLLGEFPVPTSPWSWLGSMRKGFLIPLSEWTCFLSQSSVVSAALLSSIDKSRIIKYWYDEIFCNLFATTLCCCDKCQVKKEDRGLGSSLIRVG